MITELVTIANALTDQSAQLTADSQQKDFKPYQQLGLKHYSQNLLSLANRLLDIADNLAMQDTAMTDDVTHDVTGMDRLHDTDVTKSRQKKTVINTANPCLSIA